MMPRYKIIANPVAGQWSQRPGYDSPGRAQERVRQRTSPENEKWGKYLDALVREVDGQAQSGEDILLLSRIYTGRLEMVHRPISLNDLTESVIAGHQAMAQERGVTLEYRPETGFSRKDPVSLVDQEQMMRVLNNLVGDAIRYTPEVGRVMASTRFLRCRLQPEPEWAIIQFITSGLKGPVLAEIQQGTSCLAPPVSPRCGQFSNTPL